MLQTATTQTIPVTNSIGHTHTHTHTHQKGKHDRNRCIISMNKYYTHTKQTEKNTKTDGYRLCFYSYATSSCLCYNLTRDNN